MLNNYLQIRLKFVRLIILAIFMGAALLIIGYFTLVKVEASSPLELTNFFQQLYKGTRNDFTGTLGYEFIPSQDITISALGRPVSGSINCNHTIKIWRVSDQSVVAYATVTPASETDRYMYKYEMLETPVNLTSGTAYRITSNESSGGDMWMNLGNLKNHSSIAQITCGIYSASDSYPSGTIGSVENGYVAPVFYTTTDPVTGITIDYPNSYAVYQRDSDDVADIRVAGAYYSSNGDVAEIQARAVVMDNGTGTDTEWEVIDNNPNNTNGSFDAAITVSKGGWYQIEVRCLNNALDVITTSNVQKVGVGEVFITAGQSNSCAFSVNKQTPSSDMVSATSCDGDQIWRHAADTLPTVPYTLTYGQGTGGSVWPLLGDKLVSELGIPIGFIMCGEGGATTEQWQPSGILYPRIKAALEKVGINGARAILWHQGESDATLAVSTGVYQQNLTNIINESRIDAGWNIPWGVAIAGWSPWCTTQALYDINQGQLNVISSMTGVFQGPGTDDMKTGYRDSSEVHFNTAGLNEHAQRWYNTLIKNFYEEPLIGAIRWDGQNAFNENEVGYEEERVLGPEQWQYRLPFYALKPTEDTAKMRCITQAIMDQEIAYAKDAGIDYWAMVWYPEDSYLSIDRHLYDSSSNKGDVKICYVFRTLGSNDIDLMVDRFKESNYQKVLGTRPLVYVLHSCPSAQIITDLRNKCSSEGVSDPYLVVMEFSAAGAADLCDELGGDAISSYTSLASGSSSVPYQTFASTERANWDAWENTGKKMVPWTNVAWDPRPRIQADPDYIYASYGNAGYSRATGAEYADQLQKAVDFVDDNDTACEANIILSYSWNEFSEGGTLCPNISGNRDYLDGLKSVATTITASSGNPSYTSFVTGKTLSSLRNNYSGYVGTKITVGSTPLKVYELGRYYVSGNSRNHILKIVDASDGKLAGSAIVNMGYGSADANGFKYAALSTPVILNANSSYYIFSSELNGGDQWYDYDTTISTTSYASVNCGVYGVGYDDTYSTYGGTGNSFGPLNFKYTTTTVTSIIIDNDDSACTFTGTWIRYTGQGYNDSVHVATGGTGSKYAIFTPNIQTAGNYNVYVRWTAYTNRATNAPYTIYYNGGSQLIRKNQQVDGNVWVKLGVWNFASGTSGYVKLSNDANDQVIADAVKFESTTAPMIPLSPVDDDIPFVTGVSPSGTIRNNFGGYVGMKITVGSSPITVTSLARYYRSGNTQTHCLKITRASDGVDLWYSNMDMDALTSKVQGDGFMYITLSRPVTLAANTSYYISSNEINGGDYWYDYNNVLTATGAATINSAVYYNGSNWSAYGSTNNCYVPVSFKYHY